MNSNFKYLLFTAALAWSAGSVGSAAGQDLESIKTANPITVSGGVGLTNTLYSASSESRKDPWSYVLNASLNLNVLGVLDLPFSACIMSENKTFNHPTFARYGVSPRYKRITAHIGWRSMQFSTYTLSGVTFLGGGVEVAPDDFWIGGKAVYGRFNKSVPLGDTLSPSYEQPQYERWGYGGMVTLGTREHNADIIIFKARDEKGAHDSVMAALGIAPQENAVVGLNTRHAVGEHITFELEYAFSALTSDVNQPYKKFDTYTYANNFGAFFRPRTSSSYHHALRTSLGFQAELFSLGVAYNRVDPGYQSLGTLYLTNDFEDIQANGGLNLLKGKLGLSGAVGVQRDNLSNLQAATSTRYISSLNVTYTPLQQLSLSGSYSNFNSSSQPNQLIVDDSIKYAQVTDNISLAASYGFGEGDCKHALNGAYSNQAANTLNSTFTQVDKSVTGMHSVSLGYRLSYAPLDWSNAVNLSYNNLSVDNAQNTSYGYNFSSTKSLLKKQLKATLGYSFIHSSSDQGGRRSNVARLSLAYGYKKHSLTLSGSGSFIKSHSAGKGAAHTQEWMANFSYAYSFAAALWKAKKPVESKDL
ncbi:MAG: hypothetical protein LBK47_03725 [Prevotellaceae bacterium]|jgi:hypothetical protein|nr:hypothetical protein [Prevotellaceae bacterium]